VFEYQELEVALSELFSNYGSRSVPEGMYARFRARALSEGIPLPRENGPTAYGGLRHWPLPMRLGAWAATAAVLVALAVALIVRRQHVSAPVIQQTTSSNSAPSARANAPDNKVSDHLAPADELRNLQQKQRVLEAQVKDQQQALKALQIEKAELTLTIAALQTENDGSRKAESAKSARIAGLERDLEKARAVESASRNAYELRAGELAELRERVAELNARLTQGRRQIAALAELQDLIQSHDVHVITLGKVNEHGKQEPSGRAFYVVGQKLVLYAYDLTDGGKIAPHTFYVWGDKPGTNEPARRLGVLTLQDQKDDRWGIRLEDPNVFAGINEVFITMEEKANVEKPSHQRILSATLPKPNRE
jgi:hypothetical protein